MSGGDQLEPRFKRDRRTNGINFFEPIFDPDDKRHYYLHSWKIAEKRVSHATLDDHGLREYKDTNFRVVFDEIRFEYCDFLGDMSVATPAFKKCEFTKCDFAYSQWRQAKFKGCKFTRCSFSISAFDHCEFRDCTFSDIAFSGNETTIISSSFNNPASFIGAAYTNVDPDALRKFARGKSAEYQWMRLEGTKATMARIIQSSLTTTGDEAAYYEAVRVCQNVAVGSKIMKVKYELSERPSLDKSLLLLTRLLTLKVEKIIINTAGNINNWGESIAKPAFIGFSIIFAFSALYWLIGIRNDYLSALATGADITLLVGYTKHAVASESSCHQAIFLTNMIIGLVWYSVFVPTIISRISRVR